MTVSDPDLSSMLARTSRSYDALPYTSDPFPNTHPSLLAAVAQLFAIETAPLARARILELGCASGGNIIPMAARHPDASVVGIDISSAQVAVGSARIADLKLSNIEIRCQSFSDLLDASDAPYDYVICHGVYSWIAAPLRDMLLRVCRQCLSPRGVALITYNVLPGWRMLQALRDCFLLHAPPDHDPRRRVAAVRALLQSLAPACPQPGPYKDLLASQAAALLQCSDEYIAHEYLEDTNEPCSFRDFVDAAGRHSLAYLAEAELPTMILSNFPGAMAEMVQKFARNSLLAAEQYIDMASGRTFRHTLVLAAERATQIDRNLSAERLERLHFIGHVDLALTRDAGGAALVEPTGRRLQTTSAPLADALARFVAASPGSSSIEDLVQAMPAASRNAEGRALVRGTLLNMVAHGLATPRADPVPAAARAGARPIACPLARADAARGEPAAVNLRHERVGLDALARFVLPLLDGSRDADTISAAIADAGCDGRLSFSRNGVPVVDAAERLQVARENLDALLRALARTALLCA
jgi:SAM-dependent methyltransferase/methyltransferase-like protein